MAGFATRVTVRGILIYSGLLVSLLYLGSTTLAHTGLSAWDEEEDIYKEVRQLAPDGKNLELHLSDEYLDREVEAIPFVHVYFAAAYLLYPQRVYVGSGDQIINSSRDLTKADHLPTLAWLHQKGVSHVGIIYGVGLIPHVRVVPIP